MLNKKLVGTALVGLMTVGFAAPAFAQTQTIDGLKGETEGKIKVTGNLGDIDNTDPEEVIPDGDDRWINVEIPTAVIFATDSKDNIVSPEYSITNKSGRAVSVAVAGYTIDEAASHEKALEALTELNIMKKGEPASKINIAANGVSTISTTDEPQMFDERIDAQGGETTFVFNGTSDSSKLVGLDKETEKATVASELVLKFKSLKKFE